MNLIKLREAEALFLLQFPDGFEDYALEQTRKKHNVNTLVVRCTIEINQTAFCPHCTGAG